MTGAAELRLRRLFDAAVAAADPARVVPARLPAPPPGRTWVAAAGKAAASMARAVELAWDGPLAGLAVTRHGHGVPCDRIEVVEAGHPLPDEAGREAAVRMLASARSLGPDDLLLALLSGGGSALLALPCPGSSVADLRAVTSALLRAGASIAEINVVRRHLSAIHGGRLARAAHPARVVTLAVSDVVGDDPATIASGPTVPDPSDLADARAVLARHRIAAPPAVVAHLADPRSETLKADDPAFARSAFAVVASARDALAGARRAALELGIHVAGVVEAVEGDSREVAARHAGDALERARSCGRPTVLLSGGETTVVVRGPGTGGPNQEYALALAIALDGAPGIHALACDTDGIDGTSPAAGAIVGPDTLARARSLGLDPAEHLARNDADTLFAALGDRVVTGPTRTNVNDFRAILIEPAAADDPPGTP